MEMQAGIPFILIIVSTIPLLGSNLINRGSESLWNGPLLLIIQLITNRVIPTGARDLITLKEADLNQMQHLFDVTTWRKITMI